MQLDKTRIAVRERDLLEILDLSLHVVRVYAWPLIVTLAAGVLPLMLLNHWLIGWMAGVDYAVEYPTRYVRNMSVLVFLEAPLATVFATYFLGQAVFQVRPRLSEVVGEVFKMLHRVVLCQLFIRATGVALLMLMLMERNSSANGFVEYFMMSILLIYAGVVRSTRPFINEIVLLERNPLSSSSQTTMTVGKRSQTLHGHAAGDMFGRTLACWVFGALLVLAVFGQFLFVQGIFLNDWHHGPLMIQLFLPLSRWLVAGFFTVVRFLNYLDLRIRQEGWAVDLLLRAEAAKLMSKLS